MELSGTDVGSEYARPESKSSGNKLDFWRTNDASLRLFAATEWLSTRLHNTS